MAFFVVCIVIGAYIEKYNILHFPETSAIVLIGIIAGIIFRFAFTEELIEDARFDKEVVMLILIPIIIFESGYNMNGKALFLRNFWGIFLYASIGSILTAFLVGGALMIPFHYNWFSFKWNDMECISYGSIVAATDPVSVLSVFSSLKVEPLLNTMIFGESVLNDAVAIVLFKTTSEFIYKAITFGAVIWGIAFFIIMIVGSTVYYLYKLIDCWCNIWFICIICIKSMSISFTCIRYSCNIFM